MKILNLICFFSLIAPALEASPLSEGPVASGRYIEVISAYIDLIIGRTFASDDGEVITFAHAQLNAEGSVAIPFAVKDPYSPSFRQGFELISNEDGKLITSQQFAESTESTKYRVSLEEPYHVLRITPLSIRENTNVILRDCVRKEPLDQVVCYVKRRIDRDVVISTFREVK